LANPPHLKKLKRKRAPKKKKKTRGVALPFTLKKSIVRQKKNYGNSNISPRKNIIIFKKSSKKKNQNPSR
jgi:hypothetical protein